MSRIAKTVFHLEITNDYYDLKTNCCVSRCPETIEEKTHNKRFMMALLSENDALLNFLYEHVTAVVRCKRREAKRKNERVKE